MMDITMLYQQMKRLLATIALLTAAAGCVSIPEPSAMHSPFVYPESAFVSQTNVTTWAGKESIGITNHEDYVRVISEFLSSSDMFTPEQRAAIETDPFIVTPDVPFVTFHTHDPAQRIAQYYQKQFSDAGWQEVRGILLVEHCNGGGDWVRVYQKGDALVHLHVMGSWKRDRDERIGIVEGEYRVRSIFFRLLGIAPSEFLGASFQNKTWSDPTR